MVVMLRSDRVTVKVGSRKVRYALCKADLVVLFGILVIAGSF
jgi:hypothetical protein